VRTLDELQHKLASRMEKLLDVLDPVEDLALEPAKLLELTESWYLHNTPAVPTDGKAADPDLLHTIRKSAKTARYLAESAPDDSAGAGKGSDGQSKGGAGVVAKQFESLQEAGGSWHDLLTLGEIARDQLGKRSPLTIELESACRRALKSYNERLETAPH
jgi:CHAD domain-containing protein